MTEHKYESMVSASLDDPVTSPGIALKISDHPVAENLVYFYLSTYTGLVSGKPSNGPTYCV